MDTSLTQAQNDLKEVQGNLIEIEELLSIEPNNEDYLQLKTDAMEAIELYTNTIAKLTKTPIPKSGSSLITPGNCSVSIAN